MPPRINKTEVRNLAKLLHVDLRKITLDNLIKGIKVEFEHGKVDYRTNITNDDLEMTLKIALAHFEESGPRYYELLDDIEKIMKRDWVDKTIYRSVK